MTAPHGPSEMVREALKDALLPRDFPIGNGSVEYRHPTVEEIAAAIWPAIVAEVRAAVLVEVAGGLRKMAALKVTSGQRDVLRHAADIFEAQSFPPVSAPGPTLPSGWRQDVDLNGNLRFDGPQGQVAVLMKDGLVVYNASKLDAAALAYFASRAERGPDAGGEG